MPNIDERGLVYSGESERGGHQLEIAAACGTKWALKYRYGVERITCPAVDGKTPAWVLGTLTHQGLANVAMNYMTLSEEWPNLATGVEEAIEARAVELGHPEAVEKATELTYIYQQFVQDTKPSWVPLAIEYEIRVDWGDYGIFTVSEDMIFWDQDKQEPVIVDWKTAGRISSNPNYAYSPQYLRYRMVLRSVARINGKPDNWGQVIVGLIPTGKTNFPKRALIECPYFAKATDNIERQTDQQLRRLVELERMDPGHVVRNYTTYGNECSGLYSPCAFRDSHCFIGGQVK